MQHRNRIGWRCIDGALKPTLRATQVTGALFDLATLKERSGIIGVGRDQGIELLRRFGMTPDESQQARTFAACVIVIRIRFKSRRKTGQTLVTRAVLRGCDLEIARSGTHARIECQRREKRFDGVGVKSLAVIENSEVVERPRILLINAVRHRPQQLHITRTGSDRCHPHCSRLLVARC